MKKFLLALGLVALTAAPVLAQPVPPGIRFDDIRNNDFIGDDQVNIGDDFLDLDVIRNNFGGQGNINDNSVYTDTSSYFVNNETQRRTLFIPSAIGDSYSNTFGAAGYSCPTPSLSFGGGTVGFSGEDTFLSMGINIPLARPVDCGQAAQRQFEMQVIPICLAAAQSGATLEIPDFAAVCSQISYEQ